MRAVTSTHAHSLDVEDVLVDIALPDPLPRPCDSQVAVQAIPVNPDAIRLSRQTVPEGS